MAHPEDRRPLAFHFLWLIPTAIGLAALLPLTQWLPDPLSSYHARQAQIIVERDETACRNFVSTDDNLSLCKAEFHLSRQDDRGAGMF